MVLEKTSARAIVTYPPKDGKPIWKMEDVTLAPLGVNDVLVRIIATGVCHTDLVFSAYEEASMYPRVLGHEGMFILRAILSVFEPTSKPSKISQDSGAKSQQVQTKSLPLALPTT